MDNLIYLLNINMSGIKSIQKEIRLDFYKKTVDKNFNADKYRIKAIYGENGSGKSAIVTAIKFFKDFIQNDNYLTESTTQNFLGEIVNKTTQKFLFACEFLVKVNDEILVYNYSFHIEKNNSDIYEIQKEILKVKNGKYASSKYKTVFESRNGELINIDCSEDVRKELEKKSINLLTFRSFINIYLANVNGEILFTNNKKDMNLFAHIIINIVFASVIKIYLAEEDQHQLFFLKKRLKENGLDKQTMPDILTKIDEDTYALFGVNDKMIDKDHFHEYETKVEQLTKFIKIFKPELVSIDIDPKEKGEQYECSLNLNYGAYTINKEFESTGIRKLIRLFDCFVAASTVGIVFVDEMDSNLNDVYLCKLIEYFMYYGQGQLCFTTHNLDPMSILKENKNSIDFLSSDNTIVSWVSHGNAIPESYYKNGMIEDSPFNIEATDFIGILGD